MVGWNSWKILNYVKNDEFFSLYISEKKEKICFKKG